MAILDTRELLRYARDHSSEGRRNLATSVAGFFSDGKLTEHEAALAGDIILNLVRQATLDLREALSERLAPLMGVPRDIILYFAEDDIAVAKHVLLHSPLLTDPDLMRIIHTRHSAYWQSIAQRTNLSNIVTGELINTGDINTARTLLTNTELSLDKSMMKKMFRASLSREDLQAPLLRRPEVDSDLAAHFYMVVSHSLRELLLQRFPMDAHTIERAFDTLIQELSHEARGESEVTPDMHAIAARLHDRNEINPNLMVKVLRRGQLGFFVALFSQKTGFAPDTIVKMIRKDNGRPFIIVCRNSGMMKAEFASLFLLSRGIRANDKIVDQRELAMALKYFDALKDLDLPKIVEGWLKNPGQI